MAAISQERILRLTVGIALQGVMATFGIHYFTSGAISLAESQDLVDAWITACLSPLLDCIGLEAKPSYIETHGVGAGNALPFSSYLSGQVGTINDEALPSNVGAVIQLRQTEVSGKHNGRIFLTGITEGKCVDGLLTAAFVGTELAALATALKGPIVGTLASWSPCVVTVSDPGPPRVYEGREVTLIRPIRNLGTQRRRTTDFREFHP